MNMWPKANMMRGSVYKLAISVSLGGLLLPISLMFLAMSSPADPPTILAVSPSAAPNNFDAMITITGADFQVVVSGTLVLTAPVVRLGDTMLPLEGVVTSRTLTAIVPWGLDEGVYPISIENADSGTATLTNAFTVTAGLGVWTTGGPYGGQVHRLAMDQEVTSTLYASLGLGGVDGFFKTEDGGANWYSAFPGDIIAQTPLAGFALKPGHPQTIYLDGARDAGPKLWRSTNGGKDWEVIWEHVGQSCVVGVSPGNPDYLYVGSGSTIVLSTDGGDHWGQPGEGIPNDTSVSILAVHPVTPDIAYAGIDFGRVYKTLDGGKTWTQTADLGDGWWSILEIDPHAPERIYASGWHTDHFFARSLDGGEHWETMALDPWTFSALDIEFHPTISGTMYVIAPTVYSSTNAGATWQKVPLSDTASDGRSLLLHPQTGLPFYIGHNGKGVLRSDNGGIDWQVRNHGLTGLRPHEVDASPADPRYIYLAADESGGFVSNSGGQSWLAADIPERGLSVAAHPYTPTVAYLGGQRNIYKTTDGGQTWVLHELPGLPENNEMRVHAIAIDPNDTRMVYAGAGNWDFTGAPEYGWLYRSLDAGDTWNALTVTFPISPVTDIEIDPTDSQTIYVATGRRFIDNTDRSSGILKTTDSGESWTFINQGLTTLSISRLAVNPSDSQMLYAGANPVDSQAGGVFKTVDGGGQWTRVTEWGRISGLEVDPLVTSTVYAGSYGSQIGVFRSTDAGAHWESVSGALGHLSSQCLDVTAAQSRTIVYAGVVGGVVNLPTADSTGVTRATVNGGQFYGSGVYQLTIDRRHRPTLIYLPLIMKN